MEWPPIPLLDGYGLQPTSAVLRTQMESGHARQRRVTASAPTMVPVKWVFTGNQFAIFEAWFHYTLADGAAWFSLRLVNGQGITTVEARFDDKAWQAECLGPAQWRVSATLEVRALPRMSESALEALLNG